MKAQIKSGGDDQVRCLLSGGLQEAIQQRWAVIAERFFHQYMGAGMDDILKINTMLFTGRGYHDSVGQGQYLISIHIPRPHTSRPKCVRVIEINFMTESHRIPRMPLSNRA